VTVSCHRPAEATSASAPVQARSVILVDHAAKDLQSGLIPGERARLARLACVKTEVVFAAVDCDVAEA